MSRFTTAQKRELQSRQSYTFACFAAAALVLSLLSIRATARFCPAVFLFRAHVREHSCEAV